MTRPTRRLGQLLVVALAAVGDVPGDGVSERRPRGAVPRVGCRGAGAPRVRLTGRASRPRRRSRRRSRSSVWPRATCISLRPSRPAGPCSSRNDDHGPLWVRVIGRDEADSQFFAKLWRFVVYKDSGPQLYLSREQDVEHEAYTLLLAQRAGVQVAAGRGSRDRRSGRGAAGRPRARRSDPRRSQRRGRDRRSARRTCGIR